jgi:hypothetical protein
VCAFPLDRLGYTVWYNDEHVHAIAQGGNGWCLKTVSYLQFNTDKAMLPLARGHKSSASTG